MNGFFDAVSLLTRLRTRGGRDTARAIPWMPVVGALIGFSSGLVYWLAHIKLTPLISASLAITEISLARLLSKRRSWISDPPRVCKTQRPILVTPKV